MHCSARVSDITLKDLNRELDQIFLKISDLEQWRDNFLRAINNGYAERTNGSRVPLDNEGGIDVLGNMMEASILTPNSTLYGDLHNNGHNIISVMKFP